ncbi:MAG: DUF2087 domain-containing protein [Anaerolineaceae bacterium]|nr:DUF2087 domain-containing protein [Anaerolineaceae bacterium]
MNDTPFLSQADFVRRLSSLCSRGALGGIPRDEIDQHILMKSAVLMIGEPGPYNEQEINERLQAWITQVCPIQRFDRVTLRRWLVDSGYLERSRDGSGYQRTQPGPRPQFFDPAIDQVDVPAVVQAAREEVARRKQAYLEKSKGD